MFTLKVKLGPNDFMVGFLDKPIGEDWLLEHLRIYGPGLRLPVLNGGLFTMKEAWEDPLKFFILCQHLFDSYELVTGEIPRLPALPEGVKA